MRILMAGLLVLLASLAQSQSLGVGSIGSKSPGLGFNDPEFLPVEEAYQLDIVVLEDRSLQLLWQITEGYYLYQHQFAFELLGSNGQSIPMDAELPPALQRTDEYFGEVHVYYHRADISLRTAEPFAGEKATLRVKSQGCADAGLCYPPRTQNFTIDFVAASAELQVPASASKASEPLQTEVNEGNLLYMLTLAFLGGAILNLMPCVFPILSLKVLGFARGADQDQHMHSWLYSAGVVMSFVLVAVVLISLQEAGRAVGWGFQLQSPGFVIALAYLFVAMGLSLSGLVEYGSNLMNLGNGLASKSGPAGSFFTGVLAVVVASPCTAPFMGTALGFATTQSPQVALSIFASLGAGMAAPLLLFSYSGAARRMMPAPGPWMETLKQFLAFPLYGTAVWLLWVAGRQTGVNTMAMVLAGLLLLTLGLWLWRQGSWRRVIAATCMVAALVLGFWRGLDTAADPQLALGSGKVAWSESQLASLRDAGNPVFVDVTADWCITCLANEATVLNTEEINEAFQSHGVVYMVADWTNYNPEIARFLEHHGRSGIPLYLLFHGEADSQPLILPQILTKTSVLNALSEISSPKPEIRSMISENSSTLPAL